MVRKPEYWNINYRYLQATDFGMAYEFISTFHKVIGVALVVDSIRVVLLVG